MIHLRSILVFASADDFEMAKPAVQQAKWLATKTGSRVKILCPHESVWWQEDTDKLEQLAHPLREHGIPVKVDHPWGTAVEEIIREAQTGRHDFVVKAASPEDGSRTLFGASGLQLLSACPCPVSIVQPHQERRFERVVAVSATPDENVVRKTLELGDAVAKLHEAEFHVASTHVGTKDSLIKDSSRIVHGLAGELARSIRRLVTQLKADLVVLGNGGRSGLTGLLQGTSADRVLRRVNCGLLTFNQSSSSVPAPHLFGAGKTEPMNR